MLRKTLTILSLIGRVGSRFHINETNKLLGDSWAN